MGWSAHLVETLTGQVGPRMRIIGGTWVDGPLNDATSGEISVPTRDMVGFDPWWRTAWSGSVLVCWDGHPVVAGPILDDPTGDIDSVLVRFGGLWDLLDYRAATARDFSEGQGAELAESTLTLTGGSLGTIAQDVVRAIQARPNGWFPIRYASPRETGTGRVRNYQGSNISNIFAGKLLREITEVINGPDIVFRPEWVEPGTRMRWAMHHGTEGMPEIAQERVFSVDLTAPKARVAEPMVSSQSSRLARAYGSGAGEGETTVVTVVDRAPQEHVPWLETIVSDGQVEESSTHLLKARGRGLIQPRQVVQMQVTLPAGGDLMPLHTWNTGDEMVVRVPDGFLYVGRGEYRMRIVSRSGSLDSESVKVEFQPEERVG